VRLFFATANRVPHPENRSPTRPTARIHLAIHVPPGRHVNRLSGPGRPASKHHKPNLQKDLHDACRERHCLSLAFDNRPYEQDDEKVTRPAAPGNTTAAIAPRRGTWMS